MSLWALTVILKLSSLTVSASGFYRIIFCDLDCCGEIDSDHIISTKSIIFWFPKAERKIGVVLLVKYNS
jgi:hypothetical protein